MPPWLWGAIAVFWTGFLATIVLRKAVTRLTGLSVLLLVSLFLALAIEPGVNRLGRRGWKRGRATALILFAVVLGALVFLFAIGSLVATQIADLLTDSEDNVNEIVDTINDLFNTNIDPQAVNDAINDPDGPVQEFIQNQQDNAFQLSVRALGVLLQTFSVLLFTFYLVADGPRLRRVICARLRPERQVVVLDAWELAITKTGGYLYSRALLAGLSALFHWIVFQSLGTTAPAAMAVWVGLVSQFLPVIGTYLAGVLPVLLTLIDSPLKALIVLGFIAIYQQIENYVFAPRITARTMELHPALAFGSALGGAAVLGPVGAILALPAAAMVQALASTWGPRHDVVDSDLTRLPPPRRRGDRRRRRDADATTATM